MPKYELYIQRQIWEHNSVIIEADAIEDAKIKLNEMLKQVNCLSENPFPDGFWEAWDQGDPGDIEYSGDYFEFESGIDSTEDKLLDIPLSERGFAESNLQ